MFSDHLENTFNDIPAGDFDCHIVGASFAGSVLACRLADRGMRPLLIDRALPGSRLKCAGGIDFAVFASLGVDVPHVRCEKAVVHVNGKEYSKRADYAVVDRRRLDAALFEKALGKGAEFAKAKYLSHDTSSNRMSVKAEGVRRDLRYRRLALASGCPPFKNRSRFWKPYALAITQTVKSESIFPDSLFFCFDTKVLNGYYWIFPMPDGRVNVGCGSVNDFSTLKLKLEDFKARFGVGGPVEKAGGGAIPLCVSKSLNSGNVWRLGDAAGTVQPLTGEGLKYSALAADIVADAIASDGNTDARWLCSRPFVKLYLAGLFLKTCFVSVRYGRRIYSSAMKLAIGGKK